MLYRQIIPVGPFGANTVVLWGDDAKAWVVDPGADADAIAAFLEGRDLAPVLIACTHAHFDHIDGIPELLKRYPGLPVHANAGDGAMFGHPLNCWEPEYPCAPRPATLTLDLDEGATLQAGGLSAKILSTPGHTPGSVCLHFEDSNLLLTGDTLFAGSCGRTDFPGGSMAQMSASLKRLATLPPGTDVIPGHGTATTIGRELQTNPFMQEAAR